MKLTNVVTGKLSKANWLRIACRIDGDFIGSDNNFSCDKTPEFYFLTTNLCDEASLIKVFVNNIYEDGIIKIERLGFDTNGWEEIHSMTYKSVQEMLNRIFPVK